MLNTEGLSLSKTDNDLKRWFLISKIRNNVYDLNIIYNEMA